MAYSLIQLEDFINKGFIIIDSCNNLHQNYKSKPTKFASQIVKDNYVQIQALLSSQPSMNQVSDLLEEEVYSESDRNAFKHVYIKLTTTLLEIQEDYKLLLAYEDFKSDPFNTTEIYKYISPHLAKKLKQTVNLKKKLGSTSTLSFVFLFLLAFFPNVYLFLNTIPLWVTVTHCILLTGFVISFIALTTLLPLVERRINNFFSTLIKLHKKDI